MSAAVWEIKGASDDLICVYKDGRGVEEFSGGGDEPNILCFSDGTVLRVTYTDDGCWEIRPIANGTSKLEHRAWTDEEKDYSDVVTITGDISWVAHGTSFERLK